MSDKAKVLIWMGITAMMLACAGVVTYYVDPYFHFHGAKVDKYYYQLDNERAQNDGICRHFDYDALISGTSMTENFKTSEMDKLFGVKSIKVSFSGAHYQEFMDNIARAISYNPKLKLVLCSIDLDTILNTYEAGSKDALAQKRPKYLYDKNPFNDIEYVLNREILFKRVYNMFEGAKEGKTGITSFDAYSNWQSQFYTFGKNSVYSNEIRATSDNKEHLTDEDIDSIRDNFERSIFSVTDANSEIKFIFYYPPYSIAWWDDCNAEGKEEKYFEAERLLTEMMLERKNIDLYSFYEEDIVTDLNNYKDKKHYGEWINSLILKRISEGKNQITKDNYIERLSEEKKTLNHDYSELIKNQEDYEADLYAGALVNHEISGVLPTKMDCEGVFELEPENDSITITVDKDDEFRYLSFNLKEDRTDERLNILINDKKGELVGMETIEPDDFEPHMYVLSFPPNMIGSIEIDDVSLAGREDAWNRLALDSVFLY